MGRCRWTSRLTVEECALFLCVASFHRAGTFVCLAGTISAVTWKESGGATLGGLECRVERNEGTGLALYIRRQCPRLNTVVEDQLIPVTTVRPYLGGKRFWFVCGCGQRVGRLYLPMGQQVFRCRHCYNLTYQSAQTHDQRRDALSRDPFALLAALGNNDPKRSLFAFRAYCQRRERLRKRGG